MIKIVVDKTHVRELKGTSAKSGKPYEMRFQTVHAYCVDRDTGEIGTFPDKFEIRLPDGQAAGYPKGEYTLSPTSIYVDRDGHLAIQPRLVPIRAQAAKA